MESLSLLANLLDPPILFFFFGILAVFVGSNLEIPGQIAKFFSLYLLMAIGIKGGVALAESGLSNEMILSLVAAVIMSLIIPIYSYWILRRKFNVYDAAAIAATYGSVSAVTFIAAQSFLTKHGIDFGGHMTVALVIMESPAIIMAIYFANMIKKAEKKNKKETDESGGAGKILKDAFTDGAHLLLLGSLFVGAVMGADGKKSLEPFTNEIFKGILAFFLLDMGILVAKRIKEIKGANFFMIGFAVVMPLVNAAIAIALAALFKLTVGDAFLLAVLSASASYIVVPAVVRYAIPEANPGTYFTMALAMTFPFNLIIGIPLYYNVVLHFIGG